MLLLAPLLILGPSALVFAFCAINRSNPNIFLFVSLSSSVLVPLWAIAIYMWVQAKTGPETVMSAFTEAYAKLFTISAALATFVGVGGALIHFLSVSNDQSSEH